MLRSHPLRPLGGLQLLIVLLATAGVLAVIGACDSGGDGDGGGGSTSAAPDTGSVAIVLTDGPVDPREFKHIYVTYIAIILIGDPGQVTIFEGRETVDLRDVEDVSKLATLGRGVPAGFYSKIRLLIEEIELVRADDDDDDSNDERIFLSQAPNKLPPKIDLNPRESFQVRGGKLLLVQIDIVAGESIHIVETGVQDKYQFRPVVFVDILTGPVLGKLVLLRGEVENVNDTDGTFDLCRTHPVSRPDESGRTTGEPDSPDNCVGVVTRDAGNETSFFEQDGTPTTFDAVDDRDEASVLGRFLRDENDDEDLVFEAEVVQLGRPLALDGVARTVVGADDRFLMELDPGQPIANDDLLAVLLQLGTKVFTRRGLPLDPVEIHVDDPVRATGVVSLADGEMKAAFVMVDVLAADEDVLLGMIAADPEDGGARLDVFTESGNVCVDVPEEARVFLITADDGQGNAESIDRSELRNGDRVKIFGDEAETPDDCFTAETVISFGPDPIAVPLPSLDSGSVGFATTASALAADEDESQPETSPAPPGAVEVYDIGPERVEAGLIWVKLPGDESPETAASQ